MIFERSNNMYSLVFADYNLLPIMNRFGVRLGFRDKTVEQVCLENDIDPDFFLAVANTYVNPDYFPESGLEKFDPRQIVDYLRRTHRYYLEYSIPKLDALLHDLVRSGDRESLLAISTFYDEYKAEFYAHIEDEEVNVFPYVFSLLESGNHAAYSIINFEKTHTNLDEKLSDLRNLMVKYLKAQYDDNLCYEFLLSLHHLEDDLKDHARIEDHILVPLIKNIEGTRKK